MPQPQRQAGFIFDDEGPALCEINVRASSTQPSRLKVGFMVEVTDSMKLIDPAGAETPIPAEAAGHTMLCGSEFRLEMN